MGRDKVVSMNEQMEVKKAICVWCHTRCRVGVEIRNGRLIRIEEDKEHPHSKSYAPVVTACPKARAAIKEKYGEEAIATSAGTGRNHEMSIGLFEQSQSV